MHADPILGKSALIHTMVKADGTIAIGENTEGLDKGERWRCFRFSAGQAMVLWGVVLTM